MGNCLHCKGTVGPERVWFGVVGPYCSVACREAMVMDVAKAKLRPELPPLPPRMQRLAISERGYPVPFFVAYVDGKPDFRVMDPEKLKAAVERKLCWLCGEPMGRYQTFVIGPMCGVNRVSSEPPSHADCADFAVQACPFLVRPDMVRREAGMPSNIVPPAGFSIPRNPGVMLLWTTRSHTIWADPRGGILFELGEPWGVRWVTEGRSATRAEVLASIDSGMPALKAAADQDPNPASAHSALAGMHVKLLELVPEVHHG